LKKSRKTTMERFRLVKTAQPRRTSRTGPKSQKTRGHRCYAGGNPGLMRCGRSDGQGRAVLNDKEEKEARSRRRKAREGVEGEDTRQKSTRTHKEKGEIPPSPAPRLNPGRRGARIRKVRQNKPQSTMVGTTSASPSAYSADKLGAP